MTRELGRWIPVEILLEDGTRLQSAGIVGSLRSDGYHEIIFPTARCLMTMNNKPVKKLPQAEDATTQYIQQYNSMLRIDSPLMPRRKSGKQHKKT